MKLITRLLSMTAVATLGAAPALAADAELVVFDWAGYEDPEFFKSFVEKHGAEPTFAFFGDEEEAFQKLRAGFRADLAHPCSQSVVKWREAGLIEPIKTELIPEWGNLMAGFKEMEGFSVDGKYYVVPMDWGATGLTYRTDLVPAEDAATLQSFADPKYQGRVSIPDNVDDAYALGFLATGVKDWTKATEADLAAASDFLRKVHPNVRAYWQDGSELAQLMGSGEVVLSWAWNETPTTMQAEGQPVAMNRDTAEGSSTWVCGYVDLKDGQGSEAKAYDFINAWLEHRTAEYIVTAWGYGHSNEAALRAMDVSLLEAAGLDGPVKGGASSLDLENITASELREQIAASFPMLDMSKLDAVEIFTLAMIQQKAGSETSIDTYTANTLWQAPVPSALREAMIAEFEKIKAGF